MVVGMSLGVIWMVAQALTPAAVGRAIDQGVRAHSTSGLLTWAGIFFALSAITAWANIMRHRFAVYNWLSAAYKTIQLTVTQANRIGATLPRRIATGEVVSIGNSDVSHIGGALDILLRGSGAVAAIIVVAVILLSASTQLGLVVLVGVPVMMSTVSLLIRPLHQRQAAYREQQGKLIGRAGDIVAGLRVLRGVGGESVFAEAYREQSQELRAAGVRVGRVDALLEAAQILLPGLFLALVTWLGARFTLSGEITPGQLVSFYGYAAFLVSPLRTIVEAADKITRGLVAARRLVRLLRMQPEIGDPAEALPAPLGALELRDPQSGVTACRLRYTALAAARPEDAAEIVDRLGRYADSDATANGVPLTGLARATVRELILVSDNDGRLFSGVLRAELDPRGTASDEQITAALTAASATEIVEALPDGLDTFVAERGREFSGGQQQRLRLARALLADAPALLLVEPTSAVDAHTEARIATRLGDFRAGRTTLVTTTSPLMLDRADNVLYVEDGKVIAEGTHRQLMHSEPRYRATVTRGED
ncbi:ABC transporter transmembrane domain-containing protein [Hamadaea tsunoensis]|uniref:ABC transporter transmembrane domain-containing protein n=1 Tax=Hamadaea tsunoensis TaxID=53368 RepID=UPI0009FEEE40